MRKHGKKGYWVGRCRFTTEADRDLIDIYLEGLEKYGPRQADAYQDILAAKLHTLIANPSFGSDYGDIHPALRRSESVAHSIYYRETEDGILVYRILYKSMDPGRHL